MTRINIITLLASVIFSIGVLADDNASKDDDDDNGIEARVGSLEVLSLLQATRIDQNAAAIVALQSQGGGGGYVVMDSDIPPKAIGQAITYSNGIARVMVQVGGLNAIYDISPSGFFTGALFFFVSTDCTGIPYTRADFIAPSFFDAVLVKAEIGNPNLRQPYTPVGPAVLNPGLSSQLTTDNSTYFCRPFPFWRDKMFVPLGPVGTDLHLLYPPPYTLVKQ